MDAYDVRGFWEDIFDVENAKYLGRRSVDHPDRPFGAEGSREFDITETIVLTRNMKEVKVVANRRAPIHARGTLAMICGRKLEVGDAVQVRRTKAEQIKSIAPNVIVYTPPNCPPVPAEYSTLNTNKPTIPTCFNWLLTTNSPPFAPDPLLRMSWPMARNHIYELRRYWDLSITNYEIMEILYETVATNSVGAYDHVLGETSFFAVFRN